MGPNQRKASLNPHGLRYMPVKYTGSGYNVGTKLYNIMLEVSINQRNYA